MSDAAVDDRADVDRRFGGLDRLYGRSGAARLRHAHVAVIGVGGVGSWAAEALARSGVGWITLVDFDHVAESNINRQAHALTDTVGQAKVKAMRERIMQIHPHCHVNAVDEFATAQNWPALLPALPDAVIDACDQVVTKAALAAWAVASGATFITVGAAGGKRLAYRVEVADVADATHDPLLASVRSRLRRDYGFSRGAKPMSVTAVFSREPVSGPDPSCAVEGDGTLNCHGYGSTVAVTATFGFCAAGWVFNQLAQSKKIEL